MENKQQAAIDWLVRQIESGKIEIAYSDKLIYVKMIPEILQEAKEIEKEQMSSCYTEGFKRAAYIRDLMNANAEWHERIPEDFETYYQKNYADGN